jgi:histidyl-tRNA synthetase
MPTNKPAVPVAAPAETKKKSKTPELVRGFRDVLPDEQWFWDRVESVASSLTKSYSFNRIRLPVLEFASLFERSAGKESDVVQKEMYSFEDPGGDRVAMRPEGTAQVARAYIEHGMVNQPQPVKLWYFEQFFRHDRPQFGRYRQLQQFGLEALGSIDPIIDAQIMLMTHRFYRELGVEVILHVNSLGTPASRKDYISELLGYFKQHKNKLSELDKKRMLKNPLRLLDSKEPGMAELKAGAPQIIDYLDAESKAHFMKALEYLDEAEVPYVLDPHLVRGLDYYTHSIFEVYMQNPKNEEMKGLALGGGGRYDGLVPMLGGRENTGAMGAGLGVDRTILAMKQSGVFQLAEERRVDIFFCQLGEAARRKGLAVFEKIRVGGMSCAEAFGKGSLKAQLEVADKLKAKMALILGQKEVLDGTIIVRDMDSGAQEIVDVEKVVGLLARRVVAKNKLSLVEKTAIAAENLEAGIVPVAPEVKKAPAPKPIAPIQKKRKLFGRH